MSIILLTEEEADMPSQENWVDIGDTEHGRQRVIKQECKISLSAEFPLCCGGSRVFVYIYNVTLLEVEAV